MDGEKTLKKRSAPSEIEKFIISGQKYGSRPPEDEFIFVARCQAE